jgi:MYXO-CTERM domain-containing protein
MPPLCGSGKNCVEAMGACQCAAPCSQGEFPCPGGQACVEVTDSQTGAPLGSYCIADNCGNCAAKTTIDAQGTVLCAPAGTMLANCGEVPECTCKGQNGCNAPCFGVTCDAPLVCTNFGPNAGSCVPNNCFNVPCQGCGKVCTDAGSCAENPCTESSCPAGQACKPSDDFLSFTCTPSCADAVCGAGETCKDGVCVAGCNPPCAATQYCDLAQAPPACVDSKCSADSCPNGGCCDPATGACGACPCEGVLCPDGQECKDGECGEPTNGSGSSTGATSTSTGVGGGTGSGTGGNGTGGEGGDRPSGVWGLATGGGGCATSSAPSRGGYGAALAGIAIALAAIRRRRSSRVEGGAR